MLQKGWWMYALYCFTLLIIPLIIILKEFYKVQNTKGYHNISSKLKLVMLAGILSMLLLKIYL
jgi:4-hydroxybenzoate polyprenyltransferase